MTRDDPRAAANLPGKPDRVPGPLGKTPRQGVVDEPPGLPGGRSVHGLAGEVIARLSRRRSRAGAFRPGVTDLTWALVSRDEAASVEIAQRLLAETDDIGEVYLTYLAGAARDLGELWRLSEVTSVQVTIALTRIYGIMRRASARLHPLTAPDGRHAVFATTPGDRHTLGATIAADLYRREGWLIDLKIGRGHAELTADLARTDFDTIVLGLSTSAALPDLARLVAHIRRRHPRATILVSGRAAALLPGPVLDTGADAVAEDFDSLRAAMTSCCDSAAARKAMAQP